MPGTLSKDFLLVTRDFFGIWALGGAKSRKTGAGAGVSGIKKRKRGQRNSGAKFEKVLRCRGAKNSTKRGLRPRVKERTGEQIQVAC